MSDRSAPGVDGGACDVAFRALDALEFADWQGWPAGCDYGRFASRYPRADAYDAVNALGRSAQLVANRLHDVPGCRGGARCWYDHGAVVLLQLGYPELDVSELVAALGPPELTVDLAVSVGVVADGGLVYPERGIAVFVDPPGPTAARVELFPRTDAEDFLDRLHVDESDGGIEDEDDW